MNNEPLERTAKTVDEAIDLAIHELGVGRDAVEVDVVSQGRGGILGIGSEPAKVRVSLITGSTAGASAALGVVTDLLGAMKADVTPTIRSSGTGPDDPAVIDIQGEDAGLIIGRRGETLRALQYIANIVLGHREDDAGPIVVDVEGYRDRRQQQINELAERMAEQAISKGRPVTLEAMSAADRRMVHVALAEDKGVTTESTGEGTQRRVTITPTGERNARSSQGGGGDRGRRRSDHDRGDGAFKGADRNSGGRSEYRPSYRDDRD